MLTVASILLGIVILSVIIIFHELGHLLIAKKNGIYVPEFSLGMGPKLFGFKIGETTYCVRLLLIGGACQMLGEDDDNADERSFNAKGPWARFATLFAGPFFNFILAFVFAAIVIAIIGHDPVEVLYVEDNSPATRIQLTEDEENGDMAGKVISMQMGDVVTSFDDTGYSVCRDFLIHFEFEDYDETPLEISFERDGREYKGVITPSILKRYQCGFSYTNNDEPAELGTVTEGMPFDEAGIKSGDVIKAVNGTAIASGSELFNYLEEHPLDGSAITVVYEHKGTEKTAQVTPNYDASFVKPTYSSNSLGLLFDHNLREDVGPLEIMKYAFVEVKYNIMVELKGLGKLITGNMSMDNMGGPVRIVSEIENTVETSKKDGALYVFLNMANWLIMISASLGIVNLLPLPALDGGRLIFVIIELITHKKVDKKKEGLVHAIGMVLLLLLMVFVFFNDIKNVFL